jgi:hypothetical protein
MNDQCSQWHQFLSDQFLSGFFAAIDPNIRELNLLDPVVIVRSNAEFCFYH